MSTPTAARMHVEVHGDGPETVVFAHGLLWDGRLYERQVEAFRDRYRCVTFDFRGHGRGRARREEPGTIGHRPAR